MPSTLASAERRLLSAVLIDALRVLYFGHRAAYRQEVWEWMTDRFAVGPFGFEALCEALDLDPGAIRTMVRHNLELRGRPLPVALGRAA